MYCSDIIEVENRSLSSFLNHYAEYESELLFYDIYGYIEEYEW
jgi:hypothetical protein